METKDVEAITDVLKLGLSIFTRAKNGGTLLIGTSRVYRNKRQTLSSEYSLTQSILPETKHVAGKAEDIARMALDMADHSIVSQARQAMSKFLKQNQGARN